MSIRMIARELYMIQQQVDRLERDLRSAPPGKKEEGEEQLRRTRAERDRIRAMLEGNKEPSPYRKPR